MCRLQQQDGSLSSEPDEMRNIATQFYRTLLIEETPLRVGFESKQVVLSHVCRSVTNGMHVQLSAPFSREELLEALRALARDSRSRVDACPLLFSCSIVILW